MKKILFISNVGKKITNFSIPSITAAKNLGYEFHMAANYSKFEDNASKYNVKIHHIDLYRNPLDLKNIKAYKQMLDLIEKEKYDVIHCNTPIGGVLGRLCGKKAGVRKIIYTAHGFHFYKGAPLISRTIFKWAEMWMAQYTDAIITINQEDFETAEKFKLKENGKVYYIPGVGIDTSFIKETKPKRGEIINQIEANKDSILLISIGELNKNKNNEVIIKALGKLKNLKLHYILCGVGDKEDELYSLAKECGLEKNVHFLGYRTDIPDLLKSCDIFMLPSYREGLSRSLMEAMSAGLPCIVSKIRGNVDLIQDDSGGFLCNPDDIQMFIESISVLVNDSKLRKKMGVNNMKVIEKFDVENIKLEMKMIYEEILKNKEDAKLGGN